MNKISFDIPIAREKDVVVIGGGCAGIAAAVCAARRGASVLLVDKNGFLGGMATAGLVGPFMTCYDPAGDRQVIKGIFDEFVQRMVEDNGAIHPEKIEAGTSYSGYRVHGHSHCGPFDSESFKRVAEDMCIESGVELLYNALYISSSMNDEGNQLKGAILATKSGLMQVNAKLFIDCTGDADLAYGSGVPFVYGDETGQTQPGSLFFTIRGVDKSELEKIRQESGDFRTIFFQDLIGNEIACGRYSVLRDKLAVYENPDGTFRVNMSRIFLKDGCDPFEVTNASIKGRQQVLEIISLMRRLIPGFQNVELVESACMLGLRETRRIQGDFVLTERDIKENHTFDDVVFLSGNSIDMHSCHTVNYQPATGAAYQIPYRILLPKKIRNLLVAGRCCSLDRVALAAIRVMPPVFAMGQAAGTAAALCAKLDVAPADVPISQLQKHLLEDGAVLK
jgi:hypothetical protein